MNSKGLPRIAFGRTGWQVTRLGIGTIPLIKLPERVSEETLNHALDVGINLVDTAEQYEPMQERIGRFISHRRKEYVLTTKTYALKGDEARRSLEKSLKAMRTDVIDGYLVHSVSSLDRWNEVRADGAVLSVLQLAREQGVIGQVGISVHRDVRVMREAIESGLFSFIMLAYSPLDQENVAREILPLAHEHGMGVMLMKVMSGGQIIPGPADMPPADGELLKRLILRHCLGNPNVDVAVVGMNSVEQVDSNAATAREPPGLTPQETDRMYRLLSRMNRDLRYGQMCLRCYYCQPCPQGVPIPEVFRAGDAITGYGEDLRSLADQMYRDLRFEPTLCVECGECVRKCPAGIDIPKRLREVAAMFTTARTV